MTHFARQGVMNSLEASRVLAVLDESLDSMRLLSFVTSEVLDTAEQLQDLLGEDMSNLLVKHRMLINNSRSHLGSDAVTASTLELLRMLKKSQVGTRLQSLHTDRSNAILQVVNFMERLRSQAQKRLNTTVEEDASNQEYYEEVKAREEKAVAEKMQLEQKLKLQRVELARRTNAVQAAEDGARAQIHTVTTATAAAQNGIAEDANVTRTNDADSFVGDQENLNKELRAAREQLAALRATHREAEAALRKSKKRAAQDVEAVIGEYDTDVGAKEAEYQAAMTAYQEVLAQLEEFSRGAATMQAERQAAEAEEARIAQERLTAALLLVRQNRAARVIQGAWKSWKARKIAEAKKKKKAEAKKKK